MKELFTKNTLEKSFKITIIVIVFSFIILSIIPIFIDKSYREKEIGENLEQVIKIQQSFIENWLDEKAAAIRTLSTLEASKSLDIDEMREIYSNFVSNNPDFQAIVFVSKEGFATMDTQTSETVNVDVSDRLYFTEAKEKREHISDVIKGRNTGSLVIVFSAPILDESGNFQGLIMGPVHLGTIDDLMNKLTIGKTGETYLADSNGKIITHTRNLPNVEDELSINVPIELLEQAKTKAKNNAFQYNDYRDVDVIGTYKWTNSNRWLIVGKIDKKEVLQPFYTSTLLMVLLTVFVFTIVFFLLKKIHLSIQYSINHLLLGAKSIINGNYSNRIKNKEIEEGPSELRELSVVFNEMAMTIEENLQRYKSLFDHNHDAVFSTDLNGKFIKANKNCKKISGYDIDETLELSFMPLVSEEDVKETIVYFKKTITEGKPQTFETKIITKNQQAVLLNVTTMPIFVRGKIVGVYGVAKDITELRKSEKALKDLTASLRESNKDLAQFAYVASHDLQEPLRMVTNYLQLLERRYSKELDSDALDFINYAVDGAKRMQQLINDLLAYSRINTSARKPTEVNLNEVIKNVINNLDFDMKEKNAKICFSTLPTVNVNEIQFIQLFQNLISNGMKFQNEKNPEIVITAQRGVKEWIISVSDNGIGISEEYKERIFEMFQRLHTTHEYTGTGIGLAICKRIVERHSGKIWVDSEERVGSTFSFTIPDMNENS